jgi:hypothetical protein
VSQVQLLTQGVIIDVLVYLLLPLAGTVQGDVIRQVVYRYTRGIFSVGKILWLMEQV